MHKLARNPHREEFFAFVSANLCDAVDATDLISSPPPLNTPSPPRRTTTFSPSWPRTSTSRCWATWSTASSPPTSPSSSPTRRGWPTSWRRTPSAGTCPITGMSDAHTGGGGIRVIRLSKFHGIWKYESKQIILFCIHIALEEVWAF